MTANVAVADRFADCLPAAHTFFSLLLAWHPAQQGPCSDAPSLILPKGIFVAVASLRCSSLAGYIKVLFKKYIKTLKKKSS